MEKKYQMVRQNLKLIELCEDLCCIWHIAHKNYRNRKIEYQAFQETTDEQGMEKADSLHKS